MLDRLMVYGSRDKGADTGLLTLGFLILLLVFISSSDVLEESQTQEEVAASSIVPDGALLLFRLSCVVLVVITLSWIALDPKGSKDYPLFFKDREIRRRDVVGPTRLAAFTMWHFALIGISFATSGYATWIHMSGGEVPEWILLASPILFSSAFACAILVTCVITFHLIGDNQRKGKPIDQLFSWYEIVMHNVNVAIMAISLILNDMHVEWKYFVFPAVIGIVYVFWAAIYANFISGVFIYEFMDYRMAGAPVIYFILFVLQISFFFVVLALDRLAEWNIVLGFVTAMGMTWAISALKEPVHG